MLRISNLAHLLSHFSFDFTLRGCFSRWIADGHSYRLFQAFVWPMDSLLSYCMAGWLVIITQGDLRHTLLALLSSLSLNPHLFFYSFSRSAASLVHAYGSSFFLSRVMEPGVQMPFWHTLMLGPEILQSLSSILSFPPCRRSLGFGVTNIIDV
jgi:hypothetical protein